MFFASISSPLKWLAKQIPLQNLQIRTFKKHSPETFAKDTGASIYVHQGESAKDAYYRLQRLIRASGVRDTVKMQSRFESNPAKKRRLRRAREWSIYLKGMRLQVKKAADLKKRFLLWINLDLSLKSFNFPKPPAFNKYNNYSIDL